MTDPSGMVSALESGVLTHRQVVAFAVGAAALGYALSLQLSQTCLVQGTCTLDPPWGNNGSNSGNSNGGGSSVAQLADDIFSFTRVKGVTQAVAQAAAAACAGSAAVASVFGDANAACSGPDVRIFFVGQLDLPDHFGHIAKAIAGNPTWVKLNKGSGSASRGWLDAQPTCVQARAQGEACDEYPFASTVQGGGPGAHPELFGSPQSEVFSLHGVDRQESSRQGGKLGAMYRSSRCGMTQGTPFLVITVPRPSPTFHFCKQ